jgi:hypothetical protein
MVRTRQDLPLQAIMASCPFMLAQQHAAADAVAFVLLLSQRGLVYTIRAWFMFHDGDTPLAAAGLLRQSAAPLIEG